MSASATPITLARFAAALPELPLSSLHAKGAELRNSIAHLRISNQELKSFADEGDADCKQAIEENEGVISSMEERINLLRKEVEARGYLWDREEHGKVEDNDGGGVEMADGHAELAPNGANTNGHGNTQDTARLSDEELARRLRERMEEEDDENATGLHL